VKVDSDLDPLHGPVRRIVLTQTISTTHVGGESVDRSSRTATFDRAGRVTERTWLVPSGASSRTVYGYDDRGRLVETAETGTNPDGAEWSFTRTHAYDDQGRLVEERHVPALGDPTVTRHPVYLPDGRRIEIERFPSRRRGSGRFDVRAVGVDAMSFDAPRRARAATAVYSAEGAPETITFSGPLGRTIGKVLFETDAAGRITAIRQFGEHSAFHTTVAGWLRPVEPLAIWTLHRAMNGWTRWNLARRGRWRDLVRTLRWAPLWFESFTSYDAAGRRVEERQVFAAALETTETWSYDDRGLLIEYRELDESGKLSSVVRYDYRLDARGNWVHRSLQRPRLSHTHEQMLEVVDRAIEYYD
jgi:YD repeat-containing protein